jgi:hypothetical protein
MYRMTMGEPGMRLMVDTKVVKDEPRMVRRGSREEGMSEEGEVGELRGIGDDIVR